MEPAIQATAENSPVRSLTISDDSISGSEQADRIVALGGIDAIAGLGGHDWLAGNTQNDVLNGNQGNDTLYGGQDDDRLYGGDGDDWLLGNLGVDVLIGDRGSDSLAGGSENDSLFGNTQADVLNGNQGSDTLYGGQDDDTLHGGADSDRLFGDMGADELYGDAGTDTLTGGSGRDRFVLSEASGGFEAATADVITDFTDEVDFFQLEGGLSFNQLEVTAGTGELSGDTVIRELGRGRYLAVVSGIDPSAITSTDFEATTPTEEGESTVSFAQETVQVDENAGNATVTVERSGDPISEVVVNYNTGSGGTATAGSDFQAVSGSLTLDVGESSATFTVPINDDSEVEPDESIEVQLTKSTGVPLGDRATATVTIVDDDSDTGDTDDTDGTEDTDNSDGTSDGDNTDGTDNTNDSDDTSNSDGDNTGGTDNTNDSDDTSNSDGDNTDGTDNTNDSDDTSNSDGSTGSDSAVEPVVSVNSDNRVNFSGVDTSNEQAVAALNGPSVTIDNSSLYIGYEQVSTNNQNPILVRYTDGELAWERTDYEVSNDDSQGYGLLWDGTDNFYAIFSATGTQGQPEDDFREFASNGWLSSYGQGGGAEVSIIAKVNPENGNITNATFLSAVLSNGNSNTLTVTDLSLNGENLVVQAESFFSPRKTDTTAMENTGSDTSSPFDYEIEFTPDLSTAVRAEAPGFQEPS
jgi:hypothetical protein